MFDFLKKKKIPAEDTIVIALNPEQKMKLDILRQAHKVSCNAEVYYLVCSCRGDNPTPRIFFKCGECDRGDELEGPHTPPKVLK